MKSKTIKRMALLGALTLITGVAHAANSTYTEAIDAARPLYQKGDYAGAQKLAEEAFTLAKTPSEKVGALIRIGATYKERKIYAQAREQWAKVLQLPGASAEEKLSAQSLIAASYGEEKNWTQARAEFQKIADAPEATPQGKATARYAIAMTHVAQNNEVAARDVLATLAEDTVVDANTRMMAYTQLAQSLVKVRDFDRARTALRSALSLPGVSAELAVITQTALAQSYKTEGNAAKAQEEFFKAQVAAIQQAKTLLANKKFAAARSALEAALALGPFAPSGTSPTLDAGMRMEISQIFLKEGKPIEAREGFEAFLKRQYGPNLTPKEEATLMAVRQSAQLGIARSYAQEKNKAQAQVVLKTLLETAQLDPGVRNGGQKLLQELS